MTQQIKLLYFRLEGRAELTRLAFAAAGIQFEDERITYEQFLPLKASLPLGKVPTMTVDGVTYLQSMAMVRYAGRLGGFYPTEPLTALKVDEIMESMCEVFETIIEIVIYTPDADQKAKKIVTLKARLEVVFAFVESKIQSKFLFGEEMTLADIHLFDFFAHAVLVVCPEYTLESFPKIAATIETVKAMPKIAAYLAARP